MPGRSQSTGGRSVVREYGAVDGVMDAAWTPRFAEEGTQMREQA